MDICKKCNNEVDGNYCSNCGHPQRLERINGQYIVSEIASVLNLQKGIFYTIKELLVRPGQNIKQFIAEDRKRLVKPVLFILICSLTYTFFVRLFHFKDGYINFSSDGLSDSTTSSIFQWISQNYGYSNILMAVFIAIWLKMLFRKYDYNIYEILILLCFVLGIDMLMFSVLGLLESILKVRILNYGAYLVMLYTFWAIGQFFDRKKFWSYLKAFLSYFLGMLTFTLIAMGLGVLIDFIK